MLRQLGILLSLGTIATPAIFPVFLSTEAAIAQTSISTPSTRKCDAKSDWENRITTLFLEAQQAVKQEETRSAIERLNEALAYLPQVTNTQTRSYFVNIWNSIYDDTVSWQTLTHQVKAQQLESSFIPVLDGYVGLLDSLSSGYSYLKTISFADIAAQYAAIGETQKSLTVFNKSRQSSQTIQGEIFQAKALIYIAQNYLKSGQVTATSELLDRSLQLLQQVPSTQARYTYAPLINLAELYAKIGNEVQAQQIAESLPTNPAFQSSALKSIALAYIQSQKLDRAEQIAEIIANPADRSAVFGQLAVAYDRIDPTQSSKLFDRALQDLPDGDFLAVETLVKQYLEVGQLDAALQVSQTRLNPSILSEVMKPIVLAYGKLGQPEKVTQLLSEELTKILSQPEDGWLYSSLDLLMSLAVQAQQFDWILQKYPQLPDFWRNDRNTFLATATTEYAKTGQWETVKEWVDRATAIDTTLSGTYMLAALAREAYKAGNQPWANEIFQQAFQAANALETPDRKALGLGEIALAYAQTGQEEPSTIVLSQALIAAQQVSQDIYPQPLETLFFRFQQSEQWIGAFQISINAQSYSQNSYLLSVIPELAKRDRAGLVQQAIDALPIASSKTQGLLLWAKHFWNIQKREQALPILEKALQLARTVPGDESIVDRLGADGGTVIEMDNDRGSLIEAVAVEYALWGEFDKAYSTANLLQDSATRNAVLQRLNCQ
jgi:hypothetical protein